MALSLRLKAVAAFVAEGSVLCDVGSDHGYLPIYLVERGICRHAIAMDVNAGPLMRALEHIREAGLSPYIETRLSDGLAGLSVGEADCLVMAGMGGRLMMRILTEGRQKARGMSRMILQPQSEIQAFRAFLRREGYGILAENMIYEEGKYYTVIKAAYKPEKTEKKQDSGCPAQERQLLCDKYGPFLLEERHPILYRFLLQEDECERKILCRLEKMQKTQGIDARRAGRIEELRAEAALRDRALAYFKGDV